MKMWHIYTMEYCLAVKKSEIRKCAVKQLELEKVVLSEITQTQADESHRTSCPWFLLRVFRGEH